jgi:hypothetical protein
VETEREKLNDLRLSQYFSCVQINKKVLCEECSTYDVQVMCIQILVGDWRKWST